MGISLTEYELALLSDRSYDSIKNNNIDGQRITFNIIETIKDKNTGLDGYVLQKSKVIEGGGTNEIVISFRGIQWY